MTSKLIIANCIIKIENDKTRLAWTSSFNNYVYDESESPDCCDELCIGADELASVGTLFGLDVAANQSLSLLGCLGERFPSLGKVFFHGAAISFSGKSIMFSAPSGTGKSTHIALWRHYLGDDVKVICGDKPVLGFADVGAQKAWPIVYGSPWGGKEGWQSNVSAPLNGLCFIERSESNSIERVSPAEVLDRVMHQVYVPQDPDALINTLNIIDRLLSLIPIYILKCDISRDAVKSSFEAITGEAFESYAIR